MKIAKYKIDILDAITYCICLAVVVLYMMQFVHMIIQNQR